MVLTSRSSCVWGCPRPRPQPVPAQGGGRVYQIAPGPDYARPRCPPDPPQGARHEGSTLQELAGDHEPLNLVRALVDLHEFGIPHQLLDGILLRVAIAAEDL